MRVAASTSPKELSLEKQIPCGDDSKKAESPHFQKDRRRGMAWAAAAGLLCVGMTAPAGFAAAPVPNRAKAAQTTVLTPEQKTLHALDRLTFGPRPGDRAAVNRMGLEAWFQQQLHPERVADAALDARLAQYPAMQLDPTQLVAAFPTPAMLRGYARGNLQAPEGQEQRAVWADAAEFAERKRELRQDTKAEEGAPTAAVAGDKPAAEANGPAASTLADEAADAAERQQILALAPAERMARLLAMSPAATLRLRAGLKGVDQARLVAGLTPSQRETVEAMRSPERMVAAEVTGTRLLRDVYSERQLQAVMTDFWLNHFNVYLRKNQNEPYLLPAYERHAILPHALGRFEDLLVATAESPAMLVYLDNWKSVGPDSRAAERAEARQQNSAGEAPAKGKARRSEGINENYARELMELHTLGVNGGYTQGDVIEVARCFTGWTITKPAEGGTFVFNPNRHEPGAKTVLGHVIPEGGVDEGLAVLHLLASSPATAHFLSLELAERFVSDTPPPALVDRMARSYLNTDGDISAVLSTMFHSPEFWSPAVVDAKVKTPLEFLVSAMRATDAEITDPQPAAQALSRLGMPVYGMQTPNGYSWQAASWVSSNALLTRMNFALVLSGNRLPGTRLDWPRSLGADAATGRVPEAPMDAATEGRLEQVLLGGPASTQTRATALAAAAIPGLQVQAEQSFRAIPVSAPGKIAGAGSGRTPSSGNTDGDRGRSPTVGSPVAIVAGLLLGSPEFQHR